jgi:Arc/MetJ-type ribon-helix-helix transcriptional regulator
MRKFPGRLCVQKRDRETYILYAGKKSKETIMHIDIAPETERVVREELRSGHFQSVDDLILSSVQAWHERHHLPLAAAGSPKKSLIEFFRESPLVGLELDLDRDSDAGRDIEL